MSSPRLAGRYAKSILDLAQELNQLDIVHNDMLFLDEIAKMSHEFVVMLRSPIISADRKVKIIEAVTQGRISELTDKFIKLLCSKNREDNLPEIIKAYLEQYNQLKGIHSATLTTAMPISDELKNEFREKILQSTKVPHLNLETKVDESLIGGYVLEMEGKLIDTSIMRDLKDVRKQFDSNEYQHRIR